MALAARPVAATPTITGLIASPSHITPNGDGVTDDTQVSFTPGGAASPVTVRVDVTDAGGSTVVAAALPDSLVSAGVPFSVTWGPAPTSLPDADYRVEVLVVDGADSLTKSVPLTIDTVAPTVQFGPGGIAPNPFDPSALPPQMVSVPIMVTGADASTFVRIVQGTTEVDSLGTFAGAGNDTLTWDGTSYAGAAAASATYEVVAIASDLAGNADTVRADVIRDSAAPVFSDAAPDTIQTDTTVVSLAGDVTDTDRVQAVMLSVDAGSTFVAPDFQSPPGPAVSWNTDISIPATGAGRYHVLVRATDRLGHKADVTYVVAYDSVLPVPTSTEVVGASSVRDGEWIRLRTIWNRSGLNVTADFRALDFGYSTGDETVTEESSNSYLVEYRVTPSNIRSTGAYTVTVRASTGVVSATDSVTVQLIATTLGSGEIIAISANTFDPEAGETVTFAGERGTTPLRVDVFSLSGQPIRVLEGNGFLEWDGRTESGRPVASGVYFLRVRSEGAEELRKVAVLRGGS